MLDIVHLDARAAFEVVEVLAGQLAVVGTVFLHVEIYVAVRHGIRQAVLFQPFDQRDDLRDMLRRARVHRRGAHAQQLGVLKIRRDEPVGQLLDGNPLFVGAADHLIVDVGEVLHERHLVAAMLEIAAQRVEHDERARVADMEIFVNRRAADVHFYLARLQRHKLFLLAGHGIENLHVALRPSVSIERRPP